MIELNNINKYFQDKHVLKGIDFILRKGEPLAVVGHNGAGKSTIIKIMLSIIDFEQGSIDFPADIKTIGYLPEERGVYRNETVYTHIKYFSELSGLKMSKQSIDDYLNRFNILHYKKFKLRELSKGNAQKLQLALCFLGNPDLLILDEPFSGLDPLNRKVLSNLLLEGSEKRYTMFSSHQIGEIEKYCSQILILSKGEIIYFGSIEELKLQYESKKIIDITYKDDFKNIVHKKLVIKDDIKQWLFDNKIDNIIQLTFGYPSLEDIYFDKMGSVINNE
ncbi:ATP-binding cassette domain-containing protein [Streptococcus anginosus]|uniref:ABC transporter ATP-binding protein n=1 Tax=uncultured Parvimonas sp. TaxID=747372 RepID=UPI0025948123|nr:ATP-binding cassette domain-containing protein [uncultured Parvimonas sp.]MED5834261.1 ATP-binding cassette domain-containing protein [Streptococcus anginosus]MED5835151.1 ATP-binding cassette domain-containing protein [Streptococcus anginosus]